MKPSLRTCWLILTVSLLANAGGMAAPPPKAVAKAEGDFIYTGGWKGLLRITPDGKEVKDMNSKSDPPNGGRWVVSPDGRRVALTTVVGQENITNRLGGMTVNRWKAVYRDTSGSGETSEVERQDELFNGSAVWSRDGKRLYCSLGQSLEAYARAMRPGKFPDTEDITAYLVVDVATGKTTRSPIPPGYELLGERADGSFVAASYSWVRRGAGRGVVDTRTPKLVVLSADGKEQKPVEAELPEGATYIMAVSAAGNQVLILNWNEADKRNDISVVDLATAKRTVLDWAVPSEKRWSVESLAWSPDEKRIAYSYNVLDDREFPVESRLCVMDADGKNPKEIRRAKKDSISSLAWR